MEKMYTNYNDVYKIGVSDKNVPKLWWFHNFVNTLKIIELFTLYMDEL
jgi:hypothetical protein